MAIFNDDRGHIIALGKFDPKFDTKRFYVIHNHKQGFVRAWHGHKEESKVLICLEGKYKVCTWKMGKDQPVEIVPRYLSPGDILYIKPGYYHGTQNLTVENQLLVLSDKTLEESMQDDFRHPVNTSDNSDPLNSIWHIVER